MDADATRREQRLTQPLETAVTVVLAGTGALTVLGLILVSTARSASFWGFGQGPMCLGASLSGLSEGGAAGNVLAHMRPGATSGFSSVSVCAAVPTIGQRALVTLTQAPEVLLYFGILLLLLRLLLVVGRTGPFAGRVARRLRFLAWFILAGSLAVAVGEDVARSFFVSTAVTDHVPVLANGINAAVNAVWAPLLIACGLLTLARVIRAGAQMNDDLAGTV
jgi:hypothetical protein